ncbi:TetR/AcrR family transcriptional regulator [Microbacterium sp.]|uniref:TetR/AcrR family transcriptional regulator n=1 Tax=Microbacterium sp. TaxID=51671 RepID=UPI0026308744|nr:TetR/AcrR family transcriptional regulator [Microbacterium sp.]
MPRASAADAAETARRVLQTAAAHFAEHGYANTSIDGIASAAGVTRGAVYHHYASKSGLFSAVVAAQQDAIATAIANATDGVAAHQALRTGSHAFLDAITQGSAARVLLVEGPAALSWSQWRAHDARGPAAELRTGLAEAGIRPEILDALTTALSGAMNELALWLSERTSDTAARKNAHAALDVLLNALPVSEHRKGPEPQPGTLI